MIYLSKKVCQSLPKCFKTTSFHPIFSDRPYFYILSPYIIKPQPAKMRVTGKSCNQSWLEFFNTVAMVMHDNKNVPKWFVNYIQHIQNT